MPHNPKETMQGGGLRMLFIMPLIVVVVLSVGCISSGLAGRGRQAPSSLGDHRDPSASTTGDPFSLELKQTEEMIVKLLDENRELEEKRAELAKFFGKSKSGTNVFWSDVFPKAPFTQETKPYNYLGYLQERKAFRKILEDRIRYLEYQNNWTFHSLPEGLPERLLPPSTNAPPSNP